MALPVTLTGQGIKLIRHWLKTLSTTCDGFARVGQTAAVHRFGFVADGFLPRLGGKTADKCSFTKAQVVVAPGFFNTGITNGDGRDHPYG